MRHYEKTGAEVEKRLKKKNGRTETINRVENLRSQIPYRTGIITKLTKLPKGSDPETFGTSALSVILQ